MTDASPACDSTHHLLDDDRETRLDGHADHERAARRKQAMQTIEDRSRLDDVLEHLHAVDGVEAALHVRAVQIVDELESELGSSCETLTTVVAERSINLRSNSNLARQSHTP